GTYFESVQKGEKKGNADSTRHQKDESDMYRANLVAATAQNMKKLPNLLARKERLHNISSILWGRTPQEIETYKKKTNQIVKCDLVRQQPAAMMMSIKMFGRSKCGPPFLDGGPLTYRLFTLLGHA
ncbi:MAG: hypothetical protein WBV10_09520, partial [Exiguobacterium marinum]|uniref:hypothetical protein n=1 Tax=Exiguobacterium marinum TaxID=273528 RepID=UPI003C50F033